MKRKLLFCLLTMFTALFFGGCLAGAGDSSASVKEYCTVHINKYVFDGDTYDKYDIQIYLPTGEGARLYLDTCAIQQMYDFRGFFTERDGQGMQATDIEGIFTEEFYQYCLMHEGEYINLYPYAFVYDCVITLVSNCGVELDPIVAKCGTIVELPKGLEKKGYEFTGWSTSAEDWAGVDTYCPTQREATLYGAFMAKFITAMCYGEGYWNRELLRYDEEFTFAYKDAVGYNFVGYFTEENGQGTQMTDRDGKCLAPWNLDEGNISLYSYYVPADTYTVTIPNNGLKHYIDVVYMNYFGEGEDQYIRKTYGNHKEISYLEPQYIPKGYWFEGWYFDQGLRKPFDYTGSFSEDITLYPKFEEIDDYDERKKYTFLNAEKLGTITLGWGQERYGFYVSGFTGTLEVQYVLNCPHDDEAQFGVWNDTTNKGVYVHWINDGERHTASLEVNRGDIIRVTGIGAVNAEKAQIIEYKLTGADLQNLGAKVEIPEQFEVTATQGSYFTLPVYEHLGFEFKGYYTQPNGEGERITNIRGESLKRYEEGQPLTVYAYYVKIDD